MKIKYKCRCMAEERFIDVTDRVAGSDIGDWMDKVVVPAVSYDHHSRNALCSAPALEYLAIPMEDESGEIGVPATRN